MKCAECANFKPKRKQTGWICRECPKRNPIRGVCLMMNPSWDLPWDEDACPMGARAHPSKWEPFYGKVVE